MSPQDGYFIDAATDIDPATDEFIGFSRVDSSGQKVPGHGARVHHGAASHLLSDDNGSEFARLTTQGEYYVVVTSPTRFKLASTLDRACRRHSGHRPRAGRRRHGLEHVLNFVQRVAGEPGRRFGRLRRQSIQFAAPHGFLQWSTAVYSYAAGGSPIGGLANAAISPSWWTTTRSSWRRPFDDALQGVARDFRAVSVRQDVTLVKHSDNKIYRYVGPDQALLLSDDRLCPRRELGRHRRIPTHLHSCPTPPAIGT